jgi:hypothetical protein
MGLHHIVSQKIALSITTAVVLLGSIYFFTKGNIAKFKDENVRKLLIQ